MEALEARLCFETAFAAPRAMELTSIVAPPMATMVAVPAPTAARIGFIAQKVVFGDPLTDAARCRSDRARRYSIYLPHIVLVYSNDSDSMRYYLTFREHQKRNERGDKSLDHSQRTIR